MEQFFKSIIDMDTSAVVICDIYHKIIYMNPAAAKRYAKKGGYGLVGKSLLECHNEESNIKIKKVLKWFAESADNNRVFTFHNPKENMDAYMTALRNDSGELIGYYEKHEYRAPESGERYDMEGASHA